MMAVKDVYVGNKCRCMHASFLQIVPNFQPYNYSLTAYH